MSRFKPYSPDQAYLLPRSVKDELGEGHLCFFVQKMVSRLDLSRFEQAYSAEGGELYCPEMMLGLWLYAYACAPESTLVLKPNNVTFEQAAFFTRSGTHCIAGPSLFQWNDRADPSKIVI
jgi:hypothetical protein